MDSTSTSTRSRLPDPSLPWPIPMAAVAVIAEAEGCRLRAYRCPAGVWTIGWGETEGVQPSMTWTQQQADAALCSSLARRAQQVQARLTRAATGNELGAMVSLHYNIGESAFAGSTALRCHNAGDSQGAARAFGLWNKARVNGVLTALPGLTARRATEAALYLTPEPGAPRERMPQAVAAETPLARSPIAAGGATAAATGVLSAAAQAQDQLGVVGSLVSRAREVLTGALGVPPEWVLPVVLVAAGAVVLRWRWRQRREGWA